jgi:long-chain acyl-CoA synthetase
MMKMLEHLDRHARDASARVAYREIGGSAREISYTGLRERAAAFARRLRQRSIGGEAVMLCLPNRIEYPVAFLGTLIAGCSVFPVFAETADAELRTLARVAEAAVIVGTPRACASLQGIVRVAVSAGEVLQVGGDGAMAPADGPVDLLLCSSGTTDRPKIALRDSGAIDAVAESMCRAIGFHADDQVLSIVPLCHSYGLEHGLLAPIWSGCTTHLCHGLDLPVMTAELTQRGITLFPGTPSIYEMMCRTGDPRPLPALRKAYSAGAPLPKSVYDSFEARYGIRIGQLYGATEIGSVTFSDPSSEHFDLGSVGQGYQGVEFRIVDPDTREPLPAGAEGEILIRAASMFHGYLGERSPATIDGFFASGDLGRLDRFGNLTITGRLKLLIDVGGLKVNVLEVEDVLMRHPGVEAAAVVPIRVSETLSRPRAFVTAEDAQHPPDPEELRRFLRQHLTAYKVPRIVDVVPALPRSPTGKILRHRLEGS